jgi:hypothetical protein
MQRIIVRPASDFRCLATHPLEVNPDGRNAVPVTFGLLDILRTWPMAPLIVCTNDMVAQSSDARWTSGEQGLSEDARISLSVAHA